MTGNLNNFGNSNIFQILQQFSEFKRSFQGDPQQEIEKLLSSGKVSKEQFSMAKAMAEQLQSILK